jgi:hypothetical protein
LTAQTELSILQEIATLTANSPQGVRNTRISASLQTLIELKNRGLIDGMVQEQGRIPLPISMAAVRLTPVGREVIERAQQKQK